MFTHSTIFARVDLACNKSFAMRSPLKISPIGLLSAHHVTLENLVLTIRALIVSEVSLCPWGGEGRRCVLRGEGERRAPVVPRESSYQPIRAEMMGKIGPIRADSTPAAIQVVLKVRFCTPVGLCQ